MDHEDHEVCDPNSGAHGFLWSQRPGHRFGQDPYRSKLVFEPRFGSSTQVRSSTLLQSHTTPYTSRDILYLTWCWYPKAPRRGHGTIRFTPSQPLEALTCVQSFSCTCACKSQNHTRSLFPKYPSCWTSGLS